MKGNKPEKYVLYKTRPNIIKTMKASKTGVIFLYLFYFTLRVFVILLMHPAPTKAAVGSDHRLGNETDYDALLAIKRQLVAHPAGVLSSWNGSLHHCSWEGVTCGSKHDRVIGLNLSSRGLVGTISPFIGNMSFLRSVILYNNSLAGLIPSELTRLFRLQVLALSNNTISGEIPTNLSACINLQRLSVANNKLEGKLPSGLSALSKLKVLSVHYNNFNGPLFEIISNLTSLQSISAAQNGFTGYIPSSVGKMVNLTILSVASNDISGTFPTSISNCTLLKALDLSYNNFHGELPPNIGSRLPHLEILALYSNQFSGEIPSSILNLTSLNQLDVSYNNFIGRVPYNLGALYNLKYLNLNDNHLEGDNKFIGSIVNCSQLEMLELGKNEFTGALPDSIANLSINLNTLYLDSMGITGVIPIGITNLINLYAVSIQYNELIGSIPHDLEKLQKLEWLALSYNKLTGNIPNTLGNFPRLSKLFIENNQLEGTIPSSLGTCQNLLYLNLSSNHLNGTIVKLFDGSAKFVGVDLSNNLLEGSLPLEITKQIDLVEFYVSQNKLSGTIPVGFGDCFSLKTLDIHDNFFNGQVPSSFSSLGSLQIVDFSGNNLSGTIPNFFSKFPLQSLNLSHNNFDGEVPTRGVFANISVIALDGNIKLCGGIPELRLPKCIQQNGRKKRRSTSHVLKLILPIICSFVGIVIIVTCICLFFQRKKRVPSSSDSIRESFMKVSYDMLFKATNEFSSENLIGSGGFGSVFKGVLDGMTIAVKVLNLQTRGASKSFMTECKALRNVRHRNLVGIITACSSIDFNRNDFKALVYEFMPNGSLDRWLHGDRGDKLTLYQRVGIAIDVAHALNYLHHDCEIPIVHCDLKPSNVLLDDDMVAHVGDFGLAKFLAEPQHPNQSSSIGVRGTLGYAAPEYGLGSEPSPNGDIYSYGILVLELMTGKSPTDNVFQEYCNLHKYAEGALPDNVLQIVDPILVHKEITEDADDKRTIQDVDQRVECMVSLISVGIACSKHSSQDRMKISEAIHKLQDARDNLCNAKQSVTLQEVGCRNPINDNVV